MCLIPEHLPIWIPSVNLRNIICIFNSFDCLFECSYSRCSFCISSSKIYSFNSYQYFILNFYIEFFPIQIETAIFSFDPFGFSITFYGMQCLSLFIELFQLRHEVPIAVFPNYFCSFINWTTLLCWACWLQFITFLNKEFWFLKLRIL